MNEINSQSQGAKQKKLSKKGGKKKWWFDLQIN
jgi:hypothetical protein